MTLNYRFYLASIALPPPHRKPPMRSLAALILLAFLTGCSSTTSTADNVKAIQAEAVKICAYLPTANSVVAIISTGNPSVIGVSAVANGICSAVTQWQQSNHINAIPTMATECPRVNGVCVQGSFVEKGN